MRGITKLPSHPNKSAKALADRITTTLADVKLKLTQTNAKYKDNTNIHHKEKIFEEEELVMIHLQKHYFPTGEYNKLQSKKFGPFSNLTES